MTVDFGRLGLGTAPIGNLYREVDDDRARQVLHAAWDGGIRYYDTAPHYGLGLAERRLGAFLREKPRDEYLISTKVGRLLDPNPAFSGGRDLANGFDVPDDLVRRFDPSADGVRRSIEDSLERMGVDRIDIAFLHDPEAYDLDRGLAEGLPALAALRDEGVVGAIGVGVNDSAVAARAVAEGDLDVVMVAGRYTLLDQRAADDLLPIAAERGVKIVAAAPFNSGLLASTAPRNGGTFDYGEAPREILDRAEEVARTCREFGVELPAAALQFALRNPVVATVVVGTANASSIRENLTRMAAPLPDELWSTLAQRGLVRDPLLSADPPADH
ncbi:MULTISPECIES: aldo/keto reductase [Microbacterium]|uniref:aldo/keto reductase n=1 Tax=Microbacterium TaxID=33882 RepID=UPI00146BCE83|nr:MULTISPECIES: aldo/keto reductase [Microbacterium]